MNSKKHQIESIPQLKLSSIGLKSGEYGGKNTRRRPAASITSHKASILCVAQLSMMKTLCGSGNGLVQGIYAEEGQYLCDQKELRHTKSFTMKSKNSSPSMEPSIAHMTI